MFNVTIALGLISSIVLLFSTKPLMGVALFLFFTLSHLMREHHLTRPASSRERRRRQAADRAAILRAGIRGIFRG